MKRSSLAAQPLTQTLAGLALGGLGLLLAAALGDVLSVRCERRTDRCTYASLGVLQGGRPGGEVPLSQIRSWHVDGFTQRGSRNGLIRKERHELLLTSGSRVALEPRYRTVMLDDLLDRQFATFQRTGSGTFTGFALHFGQGGLLISFLLALGGALVVLARTGGNPDRSRSNPLARLGCMLVALSPLTLGALWWLVLAVWGATL